LEVLDDAVMNDGDLAVAGKVRVGVAVVGGSVGSPARVADAVTARGRPCAQVRGQVGDPAGAFAQVQVRAGQRGDAGAIVTAILQPAQPFNQDRLRFLPT